MSLWLAYDSLNTLKWTWNKDELAGMYLRLPSITLMKVNSDVDVTEHHIVKKKSDI